MKLTAGLALTVAGLLWNPLASGADSARSIATIEELRAQRQQAANRTRRVIFNNDGNEPVYL